MRVMSAIADTIVSDLKPVFGINPWFIIKIQLSYQLHLTYAKGQLPNLSKHKLKYIKPIGGKKKTIVLVMQLLKSALKLIKIHLKSQLLQPEIVAVGFVAQNKVIDGNNFNKYLHPHLNNLALKTEYVYYIDDASTKSPERNYLKLLIAFFTLYYKLKEGIYPRDKKLVMQYGKQINTVLASRIEQPIYGLEQFLAERIVEYKVHYLAYKFWLKKLSPNTVMGYCYYDNRVNALFAAAKKLGVKTIECQHSAISSNHFAYAKWENADKLENHFPNTFFVWSDVDKHLIEQNFSTNTFIPNVDVKGLAHLNAIQLNDKNNSSSNIVICLQGIWMPEWLETYIRNDEHYQWYIRLHPRYPNDKKQLDNLDRLQKANLHSDIANTQSLVQLLQQTNTLITSFSGAALEAQVFGVNVLIYGEEGKTTYKEYIAKGQFSYIDNKINLETCVCS